MRQLPYLLLSTLLASACTDAPINTSKDDEGADFELGDPGKADGVLTAADRQRVEAAFDKAIAESQTRIAKLETEIAKLEAQLPAKQAEADALVARIAAREQELRNSFNNNLLLCAFFPSPACFIASIIANDSAIQSYRAQLAAAQAEQSRIRDEIQNYGTRRDTLRARIAPLREGKQRLLAMLQGTVPHTLPAALTDHATAEAFWRAGAMRDVQTAVGEEVRLLLEIRAALVEVSNTIDDSLRTLRHLEENVDDLVEKQREDFMKRLIGFASGDPDATAQEFLDQQIASRTRMLLDQLGWPMDEFARYLASERGDGALTLSFDLLRKFLGEEPRRYWSDTPVEIYDGLTATSTMTIDPVGTANTIEIHVEIQHAYIGDLVISVDHGGQTYMLSERVGGSADDVDRTFRLPVNHVDVGGTWTLNVADAEAPDEGKLLSWHLFAR